MHVVYGFMKQSGGDLQISSRLDEGTRVRLRFPLAFGSLTDLGGESSAVREQMPAPAVISQPGAHVLVVEDNVELRAMTRTALQSAGYQVSVAASGDAALQLLENGLVVDLVLTDIVMPGSVDGNDVIARVRQRWPDLPVILTSGYANSVSDDCDFLPKPYTTSALHECIARVLRQRRTLSPVREA